MQPLVNRSGFRTAVVRTLVLLLTTLAPSLLLAGELARLMVYLEVPPSAVDSRLTLNGAALRGAGLGSTSLDVLKSEIDAGVLAGTQVLFANSSVPPGPFTSLKLEIGQIVGRVGVAEVIPVPPPEGLEIPLDLVLRSDETTTLFLTWYPDSVDPEAEVHRPRIEVSHPTVPPLGSLVFASSAGSGSVMLIDRQTARVVGALGVGELPRGLAYAPAEQILFVALGKRDAIAVIDVLSLRVINIVPLQFGDNPTRLLLSHDGASLFVLGPGSRTLTALSTWSQQQQFRLAVGEGPRSLSQDPVSGQIFVACEDEGRIQVVDPGTATVIRSLTVVSAPVEVAIDELSQQLVAGGAAQRSIRSFDLSGETGGGDQNICGTVAGFGINTRNRRLYASVPTCRELAVIRPDLGIEYGSIRLPGSPGLLDFDQEFRTLWVTLPAEGLVAVCNVSRGRLESLIEVGAEPYEVLVP